MQAHEKAAAIYGIKEACKSFALSRTKTSEVARLADVEWKQALTCVIKTMRIKRSSK
jgi:hypothetical protein